MVFLQSGLPIALVGNQPVSVRDSRDYVVFNGCDLATHPGNAAGTAHLAKSYSQLTRSILCPPLLTRPADGTLSTISKYLKNLVSAD